jgi:hypothetical protein
METVKQTEVLVKNYMPPLSQIHENVQNSKEHFVN